MFGIYLLCQLACVLENMLLITDDCTCVFVCLGYRRGIAWLWPGIHFNFCLDSQSYWLVLLLLLLVLLLVLLVVLQLLVLLLVPLLLLLVCKVGGK